MQHLLSDSLAIEELPPPPNKYSPCMHLSHQWLYAKTEMNRVDRKVALPHLIIYSDNWLLLVSSWHLTHACPHFYVYYDKCVWDSGVYSCWLILHDRAAITSVPLLAPPSRTSVMLPQAVACCPLRLGLYQPDLNWTGLNNNSYNNWKDMTYIHTEVWLQQSSQISAYKH